MDVTVNKRIETMKFDDLAVGRLFCCEGSLTIYIKTDNNGGRSLLSGRGLFVGLPDIVRPVRIDSAQITFL